MTAYPRPAYSVNNCIEDYTDTDHYYVILCHCVSLDLAVSRYFKLLTFAVTFRYRKLTNLSVISLTNIAGHPFYMIPS